MEAEHNEIRIGTRGSRLALKQAEMVQEAIRRADRAARTRLVILRTRGDKILDKPLSEIGDKGLFVSEFEQALLEDRIDLAVHSAKDLPMNLAEGLEIGAVLPRADVRDVLVVRKGSRLPRRTIEEHASSFVLGTGSRRRQLQARALWPDAECRLIRGNVESRLRKLKEGSYDGILLAKAGLDRLGIGESTAAEFAFYALEASDFLPAACQGIIAVEAKKGGVLGSLLAGICDEEAYLEYLVEREVLAGLSADCSQGAGAFCRRQEEGLLLDAMYGQSRVSLSCSRTKEAGLRAARKAAGMLRQAERSV